MKVDFKHILCATDLSDFSNRGIIYGITLARQFEACLYLCHITHLPPVVVHDAAYIYPDDTLETIKQDAGKKLEALMAGQSIRWEPLVTNGPVAETISELITERQVDLTIAATHGRSGLARLFLGSVTESLMRTIPSPFLIVHPAEEGPIDLSSMRPAQFKRILVGCDFSSDSVNAIHYGLSLAQEFEAELHLVHVLEPSVYRETRLPGALENEMGRNLGPQMVKALRDLVPEEAYHWCDVKTICLAGKPYDELIKYSVVNAMDLIIMGVRGHGLVETLFLGSTTDRVIRNAACPVLSICPMDSGKKG